MNNIFQGDPRLFLDENGARFEFIGGQPIMDGGLENLALISLFTDKGWPGNDLFRDPDQKIGSDFELSTRQPITMSSLNMIRDAALKALDNQAFGEVSVEVTNPVSQRITVRVLIKSPGDDVRELLLSTNGLNWQIQALSPAHERI